MEIKPMTGPRTTDREFFLEALDLQQPALAAVRAAVEAGDFSAARHAFADMLRETLQPETYFSSYENNGQEEATPRLIAAAEDACRHHMVSCGTPADFGDRPVDWYSNPTYNKYCEWPWQLSRHNELLTLARAYRATGDERYPAACAELFESWVHQAVAPDPCSGYDTLAWRTIECGIRMGHGWPEILHSCCRCAAFTDEVLVDWCKSIYEHGVRLSRDYTTANWLIMEMNGLVQIGALFPFFKRSEEWRRFALDKLKKALEEQVYDDGFQYEITTRYQTVVIGNYVRPLRVLRAYGMEIDPKMYETLGRLLKMYLQVMRPDGFVPDFNDGLEHNVERLFENYPDLLPDDPDMLWARTGGREGSEPAETSVAFPYAGMAVMRTGWKAGDTWAMFDGGPFGRGHQHEDKLSLVMYADGRNTLVEGGCYAYDTSDIRAYVLSTRAHNTVRVDGFDQNRRRDYAWHPEDIRKPSGMQWKFTPVCDYAEAVYDEGYGEGDALDRDAVHRRSVVFFKKPGRGLRPFMVVTDRLTAAKNEHTYEVLWHLDSAALAVDGMQLQADSLHVLVPEAPKDLASLTIVHGQHLPETQGWKCDGDRQGDYHAVYAAQYRLQGKDLRWVTVLYPDGGEACPLERVEASLDCADSTVTLRMKNGETFTFDEKEPAKGL